MAAKNENDKDDKSAATQSNQQPTPADPRFEAGHEPGDSGDVLGIPLAGAGPETKKAVKAAVIRDAKGENLAGNVQPHGIANLTSPSPAATDFELATAPGEVAKKQAEAVSQTALGQALTEDEESDS